MTAGRGQAGARVVIGVDAHEAASTTLYFAGCLLDDLAGAAAVQPDGLHVEYDDGRAGRQRVQQRP